MECASCTESSEIAYTLTTHVEGTDDAIVVDFCSIECLQEWTGSGGPDLSEWVWGPTASRDDDARDDESGEREGVVDAGADHEKDVDDASSERTRTAASRGPT